MEIRDSGSTFNPKTGIKYIDRYALLKYNSLYLLKVFSGFYNIL